MIAYSTECGSMSSKVVTIDQAEYFKLSQYVDPSHDELSIIGDDATIGNEASSFCPAIENVTPRSDLERLAAATKVCLHPIFDNKNDKLKFLNVPEFCFYYREIFLGDYPGWHLYAAAVNPREAKLYYAPDDPESSDFEVIRLRLSSIPLLLHVPADDVEPAQTFRLIGASDKRRFAINIRVLGPHKEWLPAISIDESRDPARADRKVRRYYPRTGLTPAALGAIMERSADYGSSFRW